LNGKHRYEQFLDYKTPSKKFEYVRDDSFQNTNDIVLFETKNDESSKNYSFNIPENNEEVHITYRYLQSNEDVSNYISETASSIESANISV
jgi:hypothetical protein